MKLVRAVQKMLLQINVVTTALDIRGAMCQEKEV